MKNMRIYLVVSSLMLVLGCSKKSNEAEEQTPQTIDKSANLLAAGDSSKDILSNEKFTKMKVEIAYVNGFRPTQETMDEFIDYLRIHTFKENIEMVYSELPSPEEETLTIEEIDDIESENRTVYNDGETLGVYIYFADAPSDGDDEEEGLVTLGAVYRNTSMVIYEETVRRLARLSVLISNADVETATINHEFGHLFGLVNLGLSPVNNHEDIQRDENGEPILDNDGNTLGNNHCDVEGCLMRAELQFGGSNGKSSELASKDGLKSSCSLRGESVLRMLENHTAKGAVNAVPLDAECILDLQSNGGR